MIDSAAQIQEFEKDIIANPDNNDLKEIFADFLYSECENREVLAYAYRWMSIKNKHPFYLTNELWDDYSIRCKLNSFVGKYPKSKWYFLTISDVEYYRAYHNISDLQEWCYYAATEFPKCRISPYLEFNTLSGFMIKAKTFSELIGKLAINIHKLRCVIE